MVYLIVLLQQYALHFFFGLVTDTDQTMIIDKNKVRRERNVFRNKLVDDSQPNDTDEPITAIYFDGGKIKLLFILKTQKSLTHKRRALALVEQPHEEYLTHLIKRKCSIS